eukprot:CAMPEP_0172596670 /NCGR_PEP_ID=MMETSP1068-20121228/16526_1 /TAXON_ID=35684 /ORGANISM="Pseudopedinella elastica, Strain CCMP716" /LENGTH=46 /DNA_ID= /DNA_START= /DNA_END= /DNA_ORIENTATION=
MSSSSSSLDWAFASPPPPLLEPSAGPLSSKSRMSLDTYPSPPFRPA